MVRRILPVVSTCASNSRRRSHRIDAVTQHPNIPTPCASMSSSVLLLHLRNGQAPGDRLSIHELKPKQQPYQYSGLVSSRFRGSDFFSVPKLAPKISESKPIQLPRRSYKRTGIDELEKDTKLVSKHSLLSVKSLLAP